eukprot:TRINITY_DN1919_c0_g2_i2.p1 TRINITY_DN1919_c0_g2~~TRINITY_DN1919_c0_g2_i2.p1  ORF type:complete len:291 (-),score=64.79 TRINITY_DN1919_c0_g2_i2:1017-1889(-)
MEESTKMAEDGTVTQGGASDSGSSTMESKIEQDGDVSNNNNKNNTEKAPEQPVEYPPNQTLYVSQLNEKVKKEELRKQLYSLFSQYGTVLDVIATKSLKLRGQAWIIFRELTCATLAQRSLNNVLFLGKPMKVAFAKTKSDLIRKSEGTFEPREKKPRTPRVPKPKNKKPPGQKPGDLPPSKKRKTEHNGNSGHIEAPISATPAPVQAPAPAEPNKILFVQNLPDTSTTEKVEILFKRYDGFKDVTLLPDRKGLAFVEFNTINDAAIAMRGLQGYQLAPKCALAITFANK